MTFTDELELLLRAKYPIIYIVTKEEERLEYSIRQCINSFSPRAIYSWDFIDGYRGTPVDKGSAIRNPLQALSLVEKLTSNTPAVFILKDFDSFFNDISIIRKIKNLSQILKSQPKNIIIISSQLNVPRSLQDLITVVDFPLPTNFEITVELTRLLKTLDQDLPDTLIDQLAKSFQGLSFEKIRRVLSKIIANSLTINSSSIDFILFEKKQIIRQTQILDFYQTEVTLNDIGGLENLKDWLSLRFNSFSKKAQVYGIPFPRGILLTGVQGTGKSLMAKAIAHDWALPLLRLDIGKLFTGIVGESEASIRQAIQITEALSPCVLWIDEIDKSFSSTNSNLDNGTANRVFSTFLTWLSEKTSPVFFIATANNIEVLPPELLRKGRFDEIFFLNLPSQLEREKIFSVHLSRIRPNSVSDFDIPLVSARTANFSGAEIEQVIVDAMYIAFAESREFTTQDLLVSVDNTVPLFVTCYDQVQLLIDWASSGKARLAS